MVPSSRSKASREGLSFEMAAIGVKVKIVEPGAVKTDFDTRSLDFSNDESIVPPGLTGYCDRYCGSNDLFFNSANFQS